MFSILFAIALAAMVATKLWLGMRQIRYVAAHRAHVPARFVDTIPLHAHQRAADYTVALAKLSATEVIAGAIVLAVLTLGGGTGALDSGLASWLGHGIVQQVVLIGVVMVITSAIDIPFDYLRHFVVEEHFGFNKMTPRLFFTDLIKYTGIGIVLGLPLLLIVLWLMARAGALWWLYTWAVWVAFTVLVQVIFPTFIAPLFNKFEPLTDDALRTRIESLLHRCGFAAKGLFVMDGSRRSGHGNAYFTGFGAAKRIVFFDTLISRLSGDEIEAVLAHELGHFKRRHMIKRNVATLAISLVLLALLGWLMQQSWFYTEMHVTPDVDGTANAGLALLLFFLIVPVFLFFAGPLSALTSRKHEFEADAFAADHARAQDLVNALVKLYQDNASTLTPDPMYSVFYYSHPPASQRIDRLLQLEGIRGAT
jgi:STE24 endopeptidase